MVILNDLIKDPFLIFGIAFLFAHLIQYYTLLDMISTKIKEKRAIEITNIKSKIKKKITPKKILALHQKIHKVEEIYSDLDEKVSVNFQTGTALFVLSMAGVARHFFKFITPSAISIIIFIMMIAGITFCINLWGLLRWNLKNS